MMVRSRPARYLCRCGGLHLLRAGYLFVAGGILAFQWPTLIQHDPSWPLMEGVKTSLLAAVSVLALLGLRYPLQMLPVLLFEVTWKVIWGAAVALPLWTPTRWTRSPSRSPQTASGS
jgi:hypothetical protein